MFADRPDGPLLDGAQQLDLHRRRQLAHLVEKQCATVGGLEQAGLVLDGTGETALFMAEELAFQQMFGDGAAVDRHERAIGAGAGGVDQPGGQFLAGTGFAADQHRCLAARQFADHLPGPLHDRRLAQQLRLVGGNRLLSGAQAQGRADQVTQHRQLERLLDEVEGAALECLDGAFDIAVGGNHGDRQVRQVLLDV